MSSLQVGMRRNAYVEPHWICGQMGSALLRHAYCLLPIACLDVLLRMDALGYHSMGLGRFPQSGPNPGFWVDSMGMGIPRV